MSYAVKYIKVDFCRHSDSYEVTQDEWSRRSKSDSPFHQYHILGSSILKVRGDGVMCIVTIYNTKLKALVSSEAQCMAHHLVRCLHQSLAAFASRNALHALWLVEQGHQYY